MWISDLKMKYFRSFRVGDKYELVVKIDVYKFKIFNSFIQLHFSFYLGDYAG